MLITQATAAYRIPIFRSDPTLVTMYTGFASGAYCFVGDQIEWIIDIKKDYIADPLKPSPYP